MGTETKHSAAILGCAGLSLTDEERQLFRDADPLGFILFARNVKSPEQVRALIADLRDCVGRGGAPVLIDQEGGRVARLRPPFWRAAPEATRIGALYDTDPEAGCEAARLNGRLLAQDLENLGINVDCAPVLDLQFSGAHQIIGDRSFGAGVETVAALGRSTCEGLLAGGVVPVIKHVPGHGRAMLDSHEALPVVDASRGELQESDFQPFRALSDMPIAMTAHVVYGAIDAERPATTSAKIVREIIRGFIGFDGLLISDDLSMKALSGNLKMRTAAARDAGCDVALHCNGEIEEMTMVLEACGPLSEEASARMARALDLLVAIEPLGDGEARFEELMAREPLRGG